MVLMAARLRTRLAAGVMALASACVLAASAGAAGDAALRGALEQSFQRFLAAAQSGDRMQLRNAISRRSFADASITLAAMGRELDAEMVRSFAAHTPNLANAELIDVHQGDGEAALLYRRDLPPRNGAPATVAFTYIVFDEHDGAWRYDGLLDFQEVKFQADGTLTAFDERLLPPEFAVNR